MTHESTASSGEQAEAAILRLPLHLEVLLDKEADRKFVRLISGGAIRRQLAMFWMRNIFGYGGLALGIYSSLVSGMVFVTCMIATLGVWLFQQHRVVAIDMAEAGTSVTDPTRVSVEISEEGVVVEVVSGIEARFAWSAMRQWIVSEGILRIHLANGGWTWLPAKGMEPSTLRLEDLASLLTSKGVQGRTHQPEAVNSRS